MTTRETILRSWWAARRRADVEQAVTLTAASFAGFALHAADGDVAAAKALVPAELELFWARVQSALDSVAIEERRDTDDRDDFSREWHDEARREAARE